MDAYNKHLRRSIMTEDNIVMEALAEPSSSASEDMAVNGSSTPVVFSAIPPAGKYWMITRLHIFLAAATDIAAGEFADLTALTNGCDIKANGTVIDNWKDNIDIENTIPQLDSQAMYGLSLRSLVGYIDFAGRAGNGHGIKIGDLTNGISITVRDNLSTVAQFRCRVEGVEYNRG